MGTPKSRPTPLYPATRQDLEISYGPANAVEDEPQTLVEQTLVALVPGFETSSTSKGSTAPGFKTHRVKGEEMVATVASLPQVSISDLTAYKQSQSGPLILADRDLQLQTQSLYHRFCLSCTQTIHTC